MAGLGDSRRFQQLALAQHARAQLAQPEHHADGNAVFFQMGIDAVDRLAAGVEPLAVLLTAACSAASSRARLEKSRAQLLHIGGQGMKGAGMRAGPVHAQPQLGRKAGGADLRRAVGQGVHQAVVPAPCVSPRRVGRQQRGELRRPAALPARSATGHQSASAPPAGTARRRRVVSGVPGSSLRRRRSASSLTKAVRGAKPKSASRGVMSTVCDQGFPPGLQARLQFGLALHRVDEGLHPRHGGLAPRSGRRESIQTA